MESRRENVLTTWLLSALVLLMMGMPESAIAQEASQKTADVVKELPADKVGDSASELLVRINESARVGRRYLDAKEKASAEDRLVIELQIFRLQQRIMEDIHQLADVLLKMEKEGGQPELRRQVETVLGRATPQLWSNLDRLRAEIDAVRARRAKATAEERPAIENQVAKLTSRLDTLYALSLAHIEKMKPAGMDAKKERAKLIAHLNVRIDELSGRMALATDRIADLEALRKEMPDNTDVPKLIIAAAKSLDINAASMEATLDLMDALEMDTSGYRAKLIEATRDISSGLTDTGAAVSLASRAMERATDWLFDSGPKFFLKLLLFVAIIFLFRFAKRMVKAGLERALSTSRLSLSELAKRMIVSSVSNLVLLLGLLIALSQLGISLGPLLAGLGVAGFIVGFALQDSLSNFASGVMILIYRPYDVGDLVDVGGVFGKVHKMSLVSTNITTLDNQMIVVPNNKIWGDVIKNVTAQDIRRIDMVFGIAYTDDIAKAESVLDDILKSNEMILEDPEPVIRLHTLNESSVDFVVRPWAKVSDYWDVYWYVTKAVKLRFDEEGISIPFPQRDVHVFNDSPAAVDAG